MINRSSGDSSGQMYGIGIMAFILFLSSLIGVPVLPQLSKELGAGSAEIPMVVSASLATIVIAQFFTGILADLYGKRTLILSGALIGSVTSLLCVVAGHWIQLFLLRVLGGIADAVALPALLAITATLGSERPGKFFGILRSSQGLSYVIGPLLGSFFSLFSLRMPFIADGLLSLLAFLAALFLIKDQDKLKPGINLKVFRIFHSIFSNRLAYLYLLMGIAGTFSYGILCSFVPTKAQLIGLKAWQIGLILSGGALAFSLVSYLVGILSDRFGARNFVIYSQLIIIAGAIGLIFSRGFISLLVFYGLFSIGETITYLLCFVYAAKIFDRNYMGSSMGAFDSLIDLAFFIGPLIAVLIYKTSGRMEGIFLIAAVPALLAFFALKAWLPGEAKPSLPLPEKK